MLAPETRKCIKLLVSYCVMSVVVSTVLFRPCVHRVWHVTVSEHLVQCSQDHVMCDGSSKCSLRKFWAWFWGRFLNFELNFELIRQVLSRVTAKTYLARRSLDLVMRDNGSQPFSSEAAVTRDWTHGRNRTVVLPWLEQAVSKNVKVQNRIQSLKSWKYLGSLAMLKLGRLLIGTKSITLAIHT